MPSIVLDERQEVLGSHIRITVVLAGDTDEETNTANTPTKIEAASAIHDAFGECQRLDREFSRFRENNQLSRLNAQLQVWQEVSPELFFLLEQAQIIAQKTSGAFNLGVKKILEDWGYDQKYSFRSSNADSSAPIFNESYELGEKHRVKLFQPIELGGLGKGYALDLMTQKLEKFANICIDAGGDLYARGKSENGQKWRMLFENPLDQDSTIGQVEVDDFYLAASNPLKRRWAQYHHLVDPKSRQPAHHMLAVYTQAKTGLLADAYATALFVMGFEKAKDLLPSLPLEAMLIAPNGKVYHTQGFQGELFWEKSHSQES